jgi:hypothetical protein
MKDLFRPSLAAVTALLRDRQQRINSPGVAIATRSVDASDMEAFDVTWPG